MNDIASLVTSAADVVAPQWPLATFAARSPWLGLEEQSFDDVARWYKAWNGSSLYPGNIPASGEEPEAHDAAVVTARVRAWLAAHGYPDDDALLQAYCLARLAPRAGLAAAESVDETVVVGKLSQVRSALPPVTRTQADLKARRGEADAAHLIDATSIRWLKLFAARDTTALPFGDDSLYALWREEASLDPRIPRPVRRRLRGLPADAGQALREALQALVVPELQADYLRAHLGALPGWAGMLRWLGRQHARETALLTEYLALRVTLEAAVLEGAPVVTHPEAPPAAPELAALLQAWNVYGRLRTRDWQLFGAARVRQCLQLAIDFDDLACARIRLEARESTYRTQLQNLLAYPARTEVQKPVAQLVFCIDVRSEPLRRALEACGPFETFGFAGFFGLPIRTRGLEESHTHAACPVILTPECEVGEHAEAEATQRYRLVREARHITHEAQHRVKQDPLAALAMPEFDGHWRGLGLLWNSFAPAHWRRRVREAAVLAKPATVPEVGAHGEQTPEALARQASWTAGALRGIGLTRDFAPLVVLVGHGSRSRNNPYAAKLLCGACGGAAGGFNARVLAALCNDAGIRSALAAEGIVIPPETRFMATEHQTSLDEVVWLDAAPTEGPARAAYVALQAALPVACAEACAERLARLPDPTGTSSNDRDEAIRRAEDWSETRPEWGLARNAAFIIGRRAWTKGRDLDGRAFLHGYRWEEDPQGSLLAAIIAGPVTVAQWINLQYYASTVMPEHQGSGSKATQTVTAGFGVMQGNGSDLVAGLPWQSVMADDRTPHHIAQRLLVVIEAPRDHVERLLATQEAFAQKVRNGWLLLTSFDPDSGRWTDW